MARPKKGAAKAAVTASAEQREFIRVNRKILDVAALAAHTGLPEGSVRACLEGLAAPGRPAAHDLMDRPVGGMTGRVAPGAVAMTEAASGAADDLVRAGGTINQADVDRAVAARDFDKARDLTAMMDRQERDAETLRRARHGDRYHFIDRDRG